MDDPLKKLFEQTGWSYEDVLKRLEEYKKQNAIKPSAGDNCDNQSISSSSEETKTPRGIENASLDTHSKEVFTACHQRKRKANDDEDTNESTHVNNHNQNPDKICSKKIILSSSSNVVSEISNKVRRENECQLDDSNKYVDSPDKFACTSIAKRSKENEENGNKTGEIDCRKIPSDTLHTNSSDDSTDEEELKERCIVDSCSIKLIRSESIERLLFALLETNRSYCIPEPSMDESDFNETASSSPPHISPSNSEITEEKDKLENQTKECERSGEITEEKDKLENQSKECEGSGEITTEKDKLENQSKECERSGEITAEKDKLENQSKECERSGENKSDLADDKKDYPGNEDLREQKSNLSSETKDEEKNGHIEKYEINKNIVCHSDSTSNEEGNCESEHVNNVITVNQKSETKCDSSGSNNNNENNSKILFQLLKNNMLNPKNSDSTETQDDKCDNTLNPIDIKSAQNLTQTLNKRRKISSDSEAGVSNDNQSVSENVNVVNNTNCDNVINRNIELIVRLPMLQSACEDLSDDQHMCDESDSNKENTSKENLDVTNISQRLICADTTFDETKTKYFNKVGEKRKFSQVSKDDNVFTEAISKDDQQKPDSINALGGNIFKISKMSIPLDSQPTSLIGKSNEEKFSENVCNDSSDNNNESSFIRKPNLIHTKPCEPNVQRRGSLIRLISQKLEKNLEYDCGALSAHKKSSVAPKREECTLLEKNKVSSKYDTLPIVCISTPSKTNVLAKKNTHTFNTDRLTSITNTLSEKLKTIRKLDDERGSEKEDEDNSEPNFKIVNVVGGYKSPPRDEETEQLSYLTDDASVATSSKLLAMSAVITQLQNKNAQVPSELSNRYVTIKNPTVVQLNTSNTGIKPTKTTDVTKIKGWKKKKFAVEAPTPKENEIAKNSFCTDLNSPLPCTSKDFSHSQSVFTSNILDEYLTQNASLNISYEVPKLDAEQTLQQTYTDIEFPRVESVVPKPVDVSQKKDKKPKTLAEKRKMEERPASIILENLLRVPTRLNKQFTTSILNLKKKMLIENVPITRMALMMSTKLTKTESFVIYNNVKILVQSRKGNKIFCKIFHKERVWLPKPKKLSLLQSLSREKFVYNPKEWETIQLPLPKVYLEMMPTIGKCLHPKVSHLIESNETILNRQRVNFALSVLKTSSPSPVKRFLFRIPYQNNQKMVSMKKKISSDVALPVMNDQLEESVEDAVKRVVDKLLDYVDVLEETKDIVLQDDTYEDVKTDENKLKTSKTTPKIKSREFRKTAYEMKRLNCKFLSIPSEDESTLNRPCLNDYCKLGCVCHGLKGNINIEAHCGLYKCMFKCTCKKDNLQKPTTISDCFINRLQDEATRNLAKVEKEFTQTIIQRNNQLILVGDSTERRKRIARVPKKYDDYVEENFFNVETPKRTVAVPKSPPIPLLPPLIYKNQVFERCYVKLQKYNFKHIIPFCMEHLLYKCHCQLQPGPLKADASVSTVDIEDSIPKRVPSPKKRNTVKAGKRIIVRECTSRTRGLVSPYYIDRNKSPKHLSLIQKSTKKLELELNKYLREHAEEILEIEDTNDERSNLLADVSNLSVVKVTPKQSNNNSVALEPTLLINSDISSVISLPSSKEISAEKEPKIQRRRGKQRDCIVSSLSQSLQNEKDFCLFLAKHNSQVRILPWSVFMSRYENRAIQLWTLNAPDAAVLLTENGLRPSPKHCNIKLFEHLPQPFDPPCDIIKYIVSKEVPLGKTKEQIWVLFLETTKNIWRICGICDKNESKKDFSVSIITLYGRLEDIIKETNEGYTSENMVSNTSKTMVSTKKLYHRKRLTPDNASKGENVGDILASVPNITSSCKWRVIRLKTPFSHLSFSRCKYTMEFSDILKAVKLTQSSTLTLALRSEDLNKTYRHKKFGLYCDHLHPDKIFVGPYFGHENHDLTFLIHHNEILADINAVKGGACKVDAYWYRQAEEFALEEPPDDEVQFIPNEVSPIDLTVESDDEQLTIHDEDLAPIIDLDVHEDVLKDQRYIITNVPSVGYMSAALNVKTNCLNVVCPITGKTKTFNNVPYAVESLRRILSKKFILVPQTFQLEAKLVNTIDSEVYKPLKSSILNGFHMVGEFGVRNASVITVQDLTNFGLSQSEILQVLEERERKLMAVPIVVLSKLLNIDMPVDKSSYLEYLQLIADQAQEEIKRLHNLEATHTNEMINLQIIRKALTKKCLQLVVDLPNSARKRQEQTRLYSTLKLYTCTRVDKLLKECDAAAATAKQPQSLNFDLHENIQTSSEETLEVQDTNDEASSIANQNLLVPDIRKNKLTRTPVENRSSETNEEASTSAIISVPESNKKIRLISNSVLKQTPRTSLLKPLAIKPCHSDLSKTVFKKAPILTMGTSMLTTSSHFVVTNNTKTTAPIKLLSLPSSGGLGTVKIGRSTYLTHNNSKPKDVKNSMATITPLPKTTTADKISKCIAVTDGDKLRYFTIKSDQEAIPCETNAKTKKKANTFTVRTPKKITLSAAALRNTDLKTAK